jgi:hypothetical protein
MAKSRNTRRKRQPVTAKAKTDTRKATSPMLTPESTRETRAAPATTRVLIWLRENYPKLGGLLTGAPSALAFYHSTIPTIHPLAGSTPADPFKLPFVIENKNPILPMNSVKIICGIDRIILESKQTQNTATFKDFGATASSGNDRILANTQSNYFCVIDRGIIIKNPNGVPLPVFSAKISVIIHYKTPIFHHYEWNRRFSAGPFIWQSGVAGDQWMEGPIIE